MATGNDEKISEEWAELVSLWRFVGLMAMNWDEVAKIVIDYFVISVTSFALQSWNKNPTSWWSQVKTLHAEFENCCKHSACDAFEVPSALHQPQRLFGNMFETPDIVWCFDRGNENIHLAPCSHTELADDVISGATVDEIGIDLCVKLLVILGQTVLELCDTLTSRWTTTWNNQRSTRVHGRWRFV